MAYSAKLQPKTPAPIQTSDSTFSTSLSLSLVLQILDQLCEFRIGESVHFRELTQMGRQSVVGLGTLHGLSHGLDQSLVSFQCLVHIAQLGAPGQEQSLHQLLEIVLCIEVGPKSAELAELHHAVKTPPEQHHAL